MIARRKLIEARFPVTLALSPPAVRMVAVDVWVTVPTEDPDTPGDLEGSDHVFHSVLALIAGHTREYSRPGAGLAPARCYRTSPDHRGMLDLGWDYEGTSMDDVDAIILTGDYGLVRASFALDAVNEAYRLMVCPWPPEEDEERLAPVVAELRAEARARATDARKTTPALA